MRIGFALLLSFSLSACVTVEQPPSRSQPPSLGSLPAMKSFPAVRATPTLRSNASIAKDFLDLSFRMESGRTLAVLTRFEAPVRVAMRGSVPPTARNDLDRLIARLRAEASIDISRAPQDAAGNLTVEFLSRATLQRVVPQAACFVVPRAQSFSDFRRGRRSGASEWAALTRRDAVTVFIPSDVSPQEIRDCLHEEIAQALGPLNDLYRLPDSVFNDDNFHTVLTGFDMLILRLTYSSELSSGMSEREVAARLPGLLARYNPRGQHGGTEYTRKNPAWTNAIEAALSPRTNSAARQSAALRAVAIAQNSGWYDVRLAFSHFVLGRAALARESNTALSAYVQAARLYARPGTEIQEAHVAMQLAAFALSTGRPETVIELANRHAPIALRAENAALLATFLMVKAEALEMLGRKDEAEMVRRDSLGWARYGFGSERVVRSRIGEIRALRARQTGSRP